MAPVVHQIHDLFVNMYLIVEPEGLTLIDTGTNGGYNAVKRSLERMGRGFQDITRILITHADPDHIGGLARIKAASGAKVYASQIEAEAIERGQSSREIRVSGIGKPLFGLFNALTPITPAMVDEILESEDELPVLGGMYVVSTPGHTPGHISFYAPQHRALFVGDSLVAMGGKLNFTNGPVTWNYDIGRESVRRQAELGAEMVFCGHGPVIRTAENPFPSL